MTPRARTPAARRRRPAETAALRVPFVASLPLVAALAVIPRSYDGLYDVKLLLVAALSAMGAGVAMRRGAWHGRRPLGLAGGTVTAFLAVGVFATISSDVPALSFVGGNQWHNGLTNYLVGASVLVLVGALLPLSQLAACARALAAGGAVATLYWLLQLAGVDPLGTMPPDGTFTTARPFLSTVGNPNFAGAFVAAALPGALWAATRPTRSPVARAMWWTVVGLLAAATAGSASLQAPLAAGAGLGVLAVARLGIRRRRAADAVMLAGVGVIVLVGLGLAQTGPLAALGRQETLISRTWDWTAATRMAADHPITGVGFARFGAYVRAYRPPGDIRDYGWRTQADAAHSVPLDMLAGGGLPLLLAYLAFVGMVGTRLVRGLRAGSRDPLLLGVFGGMWTAYQAQSLVSIDVAPLVLLHFLSAGGVLALTTAPTDPTPSRQARPWRPPSPPASVRRALTATGAVGASAVVGVLALVTVGELALGLSAYAGQAGDRAAALRLTRVAVAAAPWEPLYRAALGLTLAWGQPNGQALDEYLTAVELDPRDLPNLVAAAEAAERLGRLPLAMRLFHQAMHVEPRAAELKVMAANVALGLGDRATATELIEAALAFDPSNQDAKLLRARLHEAD